MAFEYVISLDLDGRPCVVVGGGAEACGRVDELLHAGAEVTVVAARPHERLTALDQQGRLTLHRRGFSPGDLAGAFLAIATREEPMDTTAIWQEASTRGVLTTVLDENEHCHYAQPALVRRGDLRIAVATAGRAPALAKRLRRWLEDRIGDEYGELVEVLAQARDLAMPREVEFDAWASQWEAALTDIEGLAELVRFGRHDEARERVLAAIAAPAPGAAYTEEMPS